MLRRQWLGWSAGLLTLLRAPDAGADPRNAAGRRGRPASIGAPAPRFYVDRISGRDGVSLGALSGRVVVLDFWATWCGPCRQLMPMLDSLYQQHQANGLTVLGVTSEPTARVAQFLRRHPVTYTIAGDDGATARRYGLRGIPTLVVIDRAGRIRDVLVGLDPSTGPRLERTLGELLVET